MTLSTTTNKATHVGNGVQTVFPYNFRVENSTDMEVYIDNVLTPTGWTIDGLGLDGGGDVTFSVPPGNELPVALLRVVPLNQEVDYTPYGAFPAEVTEEQFDKQAMISQQQQETLDRALAAPISDVLGMDYTLPTPIAGHTYLVNDTVTAIVMSDYPLDDAVDISETARDEAETAEANASINATNSANCASDSYDSSVDSQLKAWESEAEALTADSYATESEDVFVKVYTSNGDGTFSATDTTEYSALHWAAKAEEDTVDVVKKTGDTGSAIMPNGTTGERDVTPSFGYTRANLTTGKMEWSNGSDWEEIGASNDMLLVRDEKAVGTNGGSSIAGVNVRVLNTVVTNTISGASLAANQVTLPAGTYRIKGRAPGFLAARQKGFLYNTTDAINALIGSTGYADPNGDVWILGELTITSGKVFEFRHFIQVAEASDGLGVATNATIAGLEVYAELWIEKEQL